MRTYVTAIHITIGSSLGDLVVEAPLLVSASVLAARVQQWRSSRRLRDYMYRGWGKGWTKKKHIH